MSRDLDPPTTLPAQPPFGAPGPAGAKGKGPTAGRRPTALVVLGASAGGLAAIETVVDRLDERSPLAFVLVQHLSPDYRSHMPEILRRCTRLVVRESVDEEPLLAGHLYLIPPRTHASIEADRLRLETVGDEDAWSLRPIDALLLSLADSEFEHAAVILSGTGSDGSEGLHRIRPGRGITIAQLPSTASFSGMPKAAIERNVVDLVLSPEKIGEFLGNPDHGLSAPGTLEERLQGWRDGAHLLKEIARRNRVPLDSLRMDDLLRVVDRWRLQLELPSSLALLEHLEGAGAGSDEQAFVEELLRSESCFFRDEVCWASLQHAAVPDLLKNIQAQRELQIWVVGCAAGQEAYSLAMTLRASRPQHQPAGFRIVATDVYEPLLERGRRGVYPKHELENIAPGLRERFLRPHAEGAEVVQELRSLVEFRLHDALREAPLHEQDLISCRNLVTQVGRDAGKRLFSNLRRGLREHGLLFLGVSDSYLRPTTGLSSVKGRGDLMRLDSGGSTASTLRDLNVPVSSLLNTVPSRAVELSNQALYGGALELLVERGILINEQGEVLHVIGDFSDLVRLKGPTPFRTSNFLSPEAHAALVAVLVRARKEDGRPVEAVLDLGEGQSRGLHRMRVFAYDTPTAGPTFLISLQGLDAESPDQEQQSSSSETSELVATQEHLRAVSRELGERNEALQASNEELTLTNEELHRANEEIHSVIEELATVNDELRRRIQEKQQLATDLENLLQSTEIGVVFLGQDLSVRRFNPAATRLFSLRPQDVGRPILEVRSILSPEDLQAMARRVLTGASIVEQTVQSRSSTFLVSANPYREQDGVAVGLVLTVVDISDRIEVESQLSEAEADRKYRVLWDEAPTMLITLDEAGRVLEANKRWVDFLDTRSGSILGLQFSEALDADALATIAPPVPAGTWTAEEWRGVLGPDGYGRVLPFRGPGGRTVQLRAIPSSGLLGLGRNVALSLSLYPRGAPAPE